MPVTPGEPLPFPYETENLYGGHTPTNGTPAGDGPTFQVWRQTNRDTPPSW